MTQAKQKVFSFLVVFTFFIGLFIANQVLAAANLSTQEGFGAGGGGDVVGESFGVSGGGPQDLRVSIAKMIKTFLGFLGIIFVILVLYAGFLWMTAGGNESKIEESKKYLSRSIIGLIIILMAYSITGMIICYTVGATTTGTFVNCIF